MRFWYLIGNARFSARLFAQSFFEVVYGAENMRRSRALYRARKVFKGIWR